MNEGDLFAYGLYTLIFALLALGLNVVVGFAGPPRPRLRRLLRDRGVRATRSSPRSTTGSTGRPSSRSRSWSSATAFVGLLLGLTSRRLLGDYLAIVTLFFGQAFVASSTTRTRRSAGEGLTGGPNGIPGVDPLNFFGYKLHSTKQYYFLLLIVFSLAMAGLYFLNQSRTGRAVEGAAGGPARRRDDEHPGQPPEDHGLHVRRRDCRARRLHLRGHPDRGRCRATSTSRC